MEPETGAPTVKIGDDGQVLQCAKGAETAACGYKAGDSVCAACGATAIEVKMYGDDGADGMMCKATGETVMEPCAECKGDCSMMAFKGEMPAELLASFKKKKKKKKGGKNPFAEADEADEADEEDEEMSEKAAKYANPPARAYGDFVDDEELGIMQEDDMEDGEELDIEEPEMDDPDEEISESIAMGMPPRRKRKSAYVDEPLRSSEYEEEDELEEMMDDPNEEEMEEDAETMGYGMYRKSDYADARLASMGFKQGEMGESPFICAIERKLYPANSPVCENCPGGCVKEGDMPALLEMEGVAEDMFRGKVLDSGYSDKADIFVIDVERKDGKPVEAFFDGTTGECMGWHLLNDEVLNVKSGFQPTQMIGFSEAAQIATKSINGDVVSVEADVFEGFDSYAVEVEGVDGKSYDVFVSLDGEVLGYDTYTQQEAFAIESEAAEIALKRAYGDDVRKQMAERGDAMEDGEMPIANDSDLRNAVMSWPRSKKRTEAKEHIMARARVLGLEKSLPDEWLQEKKQNEEAKGDANFLSSLAEFELISEEIKSSNTDEKGAGFMCKASGQMVAEACPECKSNCSMMHKQEEEAELYFKRMFSDEQRQEQAKKGNALPDGSYPIVNETDLKNAIQAYGRAKDKDKAKAHIVKRAKSLGKEDLIPENWN